MYCKITKCYGFIMLSAILLIVRTKLLSLNDIVLMISDIVWIVAGIVEGRGARLFLLVYFCIGGLKVIF